MGFPRVGDQDPGSGSSPRSPSLTSAGRCISVRGRAGLCTAPAARWRKPASTWGNAAGPGVHNVCYRTLAALRTRRANRLRLTDTVFFHFKE